MPLRFILDIRRSDQTDFDLWFQSVNAGRTLTVGGFLLAFATLWITLTLFTTTEASRAMHVAIATFLSIGIACLWHGRRRQHRTLTRSGEWLILAVAIVWMFLSVDEAVHRSYGQVEFIIGTLALAMLRFMTPRTAALVFTLFAFLYVLILWRHDQLHLTPINSGLLFCIFAFMMSVGIYNSKVLEFRNQLLVSLLNAQNQQLTTLALRDPLTGLPNRRYFDQFLAHYWQHEDSAAQPITLILLDIDHFKAFNDRFGHPAGDDCLRRVAELLQGELRSSASCCRLGGEEFAALLPGTEEAEGLVVAKRLRERVETDSQVTVSLGVATTTPSRQSIEAFYVTADQALYAAKGRGRNQVVAA